MMLTVTILFKGPPEYCQDGAVTYFSYNKPLSALVHYNYNRNSDRTLEALRGPREYCQDGTVAHLNYDMLV